MKKKKIRRNSNQRDVVKFLRVEKEGIYTGISPTARWRSTKRLCTLAETQSAGAMTFLFSSISVPLLFPRFFSLHLVSLLLSSRIYLPLCLNVYTAIVYAPAVSPRISQIHKDTKLAFFSIFFSLLSSAHKMKLG